MTDQGATTEPAVRREPGRSASAMPSTAVVFVVAVGLALFALRLAAPPNLLDQDQERPASYVLDVVKNGHWICQRDLSGDITSKPPLYTWLCAIGSLAYGQVNLFTLYLPGALSAIGTALLLLFAGHQMFSLRAALLAAIAAMLTTAGLKQFGLARTDGVFAFTVTVSALLAFRAWNRGRGWTWFWLAAAAATLTKGPLGLIFAANGLVAVWWERKSGRPHPLRGSHVTGMIVLLLLVGGWFLLAYWQVGQPLITKMLGKELVAHAVSDGKRHYPGMLFYQPPLYYLGRAAPWSIAALFGFWRVWKQPSAGEEQRRFERFLTCWFVLGLAIMSLAPHQRADLLWPLMPAGALIAGRELARLSERLRFQAFAAALAGAVCFGVAGFSYYYFGPHARESVVRRTVKLREITAQLAPEGEAWPLTHVDDPISTQVYLQTLRPPVSFERAAELLRSPAPALIVVSNLSRLADARLHEDPLYYEYEFAGLGEGRPIHLIGNQPKLGLARDFAMGVGPFLIQVTAADLVKATEYELVLSGMSKTSAVTVVNQSATSRPLRIIAVGRSGRSVEERSLASKESWTVDLPSQ